MTTLPSFLPSAKSLSIIFLMKFFGVPVVVETDEVEADAVDEDGVMELNRTCLDRVVASARDLERRADDLGTRLWDVLSDASASAMESWRSLVAGLIGAPG